MNKVTPPRFLTSSLIALGLFSCAAFGQETPPRSDKHYVGLLATAIEHRSIGQSDEDGWGGQAATLVIGGHLSDLIHAEVRLGGAAWQTPRFPVAT